MLIPPISGGTDG